MAEDKFKDVMLDLETMGTSHIAPIIQIGACYFDRETGELGRRFKSNIKLSSAMEAGMVPDADTIAWWMQQSEEARSSVMSNGLVLHTVLSRLNDFLEGGEQLWSHATFDAVILTNAMKLCGMWPKISFRGMRDIRTLVDLAGIDIYEMPRVGTHHDALDDCYYQVGYCVECFKVLKGGK